MAKTIRWGSYCVPQEQVNASGNNTNFYMDGDSGRKLSGDDSYTITTYTAPTTTTSTVALAGTQDFVAIKALSIESGSLVLISLDNGDSYPIRLLEGECFASKVNVSTSGGLNAVVAKVAICTATDGSGTGTGKVEYWSAT